MNKDEMVEKYFGSNLMMLVEILKKNNQLAWKLTQLTILPSVICLSFKVFPQTTYVPTRGPLLSCLLESPDFHHWAQPICQPALSSPVFLH